MSSLILRRPDQQSLVQIEILAAIAREEGFRFVDRMVDEWRAGQTCFDGPGEQFLCAFRCGEMAGFGGLHRDPYVASARVGRLRRFYVAPSWRRHGVARAIATTLIEGCHPHFDMIRLRTPNAAADRFYEAIGFSPIQVSDATHVLRLS